MYFLGIDIGTSSIKVSVVDAASRYPVASTRFPEEEAEILSPEAGWSEQDPESWWDYARQAILKLNSSKVYDPLNIVAIGIAYQMHGLVVTDEKGEPLRNAIIWCDSRAVEYGQKAFDSIGHRECLSSTLNSPGNFTAAKLAWVKENEPCIYERTRYMMLPGDYIAMKFTGRATTTISALSEAILWDFNTNSISQETLDHFGIDSSLIPEVLPVFGDHGQVTRAVADSLGLKAGIPITYKAGDQPNNAMALNVMQPGEVAATAGTSGVIYGISDSLTSDAQSRINTFAHVNYTKQCTRTGVLLCINGTGILNRWTKNIFSAPAGYEEMNAAGRTIAVGSNGLRVLPFGNGAERMLNNKIIGVHFQHIDLNLHSREHIYRAVQEGIAFAFRYGLDLMRENGMRPSVIRAGDTNLFQSDLFTEAFVNATNVPVEIHSSDGSIGAALGAGFGAGVYTTMQEAFAPADRGRMVFPDRAGEYEPIYQEWKALLNAQLNINQ